MELKSIIKSVYIRKYLKIPKGKSEALHRRRIDNTMTKRRRIDNTMAKRRRIDNTMVKRKRAREQTKSNTIFHKILKIEQEEFGDTKMGNQNP
jgi:hypothetical protein